MENIYTESCYSFSLLKDFLSQQYKLHIELLINTNLEIDYFPNDYSKNDIILNNKVVIHLAANILLDIRPFGNINESIDIDSPFLLSYSLSDSPPINFFKLYCEKFFNIFNEQNILYSNLGWSSIEEFLDFFNSENLKKIYYLSYQNNQQELKYIELNKDLKRILDSFKIRCLDKINQIAKKDNPNLIGNLKIPLSWAFDSKKLNSIKFNQCLNASLVDEKLLNEIQKL